MNGFHPGDDLHHQHDYSQRLQHLEPPQPPSEPHQRAAGLPLSHSQRPPLLHNYSAPAALSGSMDDQFFSQHSQEQNDFRSMSFPSARLDSYTSDVDYAPHDLIMPPPSTSLAPSEYGRKSPIASSSASEAHINSASTTDGLFPPMHTPGAEFGADDYTVEADLVEADPMVEIGESVLTFGPKPGGSSTGCANKGKRKSASTSNQGASTQRLLSDLPVDEDGNATGRRKIQIEYIQDRSRRHITFSKRKAGIMKKAYELSTLTGTQVLLLVVSEAGTVYTYTTDKLEALVRETEGKDLIKDCLDAEDPDSVGARDEPSPAVRASTRPEVRRSTSNPSLRKRSPLSGYNRANLTTPPVPVIPPHHLANPAPFSGGSNYQHHSQSMPMYPAASAVPRYSFNPSPSYGTPYYQQQPQPPVSLPPPTSLSYNSSHTDYLAPSH